MGDNLKLLVGVMICEVVEMIMFGSFSGGGLMGGMGQMMGGTMMGGGVLGMLSALVFWVLVLALIVALVVWIFRQIQQR